MIIANTATYNPASRRTRLSVTAVRPAAGLPKRPGIREYSLPATCRPASPDFDAAAGWQIREEPEYYIPDLLKDRDY